MTAEKGQKATEAYTYMMIFNLKESTASNHYTPVAFRKSKFLTSLFYYNLLE